MLDFIKKNFQFVVIIALIIILFFKGCGGNGVNKGNKTDTISVHHDTVIYVKEGTTVVNKPILRDVQPYQFDTKDTIYYPDTNSNKLLEQYKKFIGDYLSIKNYQDTVKIDSVGYAIIKDSISKNSLLKQTFSYKIKYPIITNTITLQQPNKTQVYLGGGLEGNKENYINQINVGFLLKNKKDNIFGIQTGINSNGIIQYGISSYFKIKL